MIFVTVLFVIVCILLVILVLLQQGKSAGLGGISGGSETLLGASSGDFFSRTTTALAVIFFVGAIFLSVMSTGKKSVIDRATPAPTAPAETPVDAGATTPAILDLNASNK